MNNTITRDEALEALQALLDSGILSEELDEKIQDIAGVIENEKYGLHMWGADNVEYAVLYTAVREDLQTEEYIANCKRIWDKYSFTPSPFEDKEISENIESAAE